jgi:hypothetical protein
MSLGYIAETDITCNNFCTGRNCRYLAHLRGSNSRNCSHSVNSHLTFFLSRVISSSLKLEATCSSETSVYIKPTWCHIPEDGILHSHCRENQKFYTKVKVESKAIPVTGRGGLYGCEMLRIPHCLDNRLLDGGNIVSPTHQPHFTPQKHYFC